VIPRAFAGVDAGMLVTGDTAEELDYHETVDSWVVPVFVFVLGLSFVLLTIAFRSIVVPPKAIFLDLLSVGAAYGLLVLVFRDGIGNELLGSKRRRTPPPGWRCSSSRSCSGSRWASRCSCSAASASATSERATATRLAYGVGSTARLITGAALIIIAVFWGFAMGDLIVFQQMGFGVAAAFLIDATIVRAVLVPVGMRLLGKWNWYLPGWLSWPPDTHVEGGPRQAALAGPAVRAG
jgi:RND superfamily putative drug exporter